MAEQLLSNFTLTDTTRIKVIGESIAAGRGSSDCAFDGEYIIKCAGRKYYRQTGTKNWPAVLETLLREKYPQLEVINNACNSLNTHQIHKFLDTLLDPDDDLVLLMIGTNDRKFPGGMYMLSHNLRHIINFIQDWGIPVVLLVPGPCTPANEYRGDRIYHMDDVNACTKDIAAIKHVSCISFYDLFLDHIRKNHIPLTQFMAPAPELEADGLFPEEASYSIQDLNRMPDGQHPGDEIQEFMARTLIEEMGW